MLCTIADMKIAFVGKGGSGKSTVSSFFVRYLLEKEQTVLAVDADINQHFGALIGASFEAFLALSLEENKMKIREYLIAKNSRIASPKYMIKTSPPARGSHIVSLQNTDRLLSEYAVQFAKNGYFMHVGTYESNGIGTSCYHTSLSIFENILSHTPADGDNEWIVVDMVAGTDAFSGPLHAMFDVLCIVVEPTVESVAVFMQFIKLAQAAGVDERIVLVANKIDDNEDIDYIERETGQKVAVCIEYNPALRKQRRESAVPQVPETLRLALSEIMNITIAAKRSPVAHLRHLHALHKVFASQKFTIDKYGDTLGHIDTEFNFNGKE